MYSSDLKRNPEAKVPHVAVNGNESSADTPFVAQERAPYLLVLFKETVTPGKRMAIIVSGNLRNLHASMRAHGDTPHN